MSITLVNPSPPSSFWAVTTDGITTSTSHCSGSNMRFAIPTGHTHINVICVVPIDETEMHFVPRWCAPGRLLPNVKCDELQLVYGAEKRDSSYYKINTNIKINCPVGVHWLAPDYLQGGRQLSGFNTNWLPFTFQCRERRGWPLLQWLSLCVFDGASMATMLCSAVVAGCCYCGFDRTAPLTDRVCDSLLQVVLRSTCGKYAHDVDWNKTDTDNRDGYGLTYGTGKDCDGMTQHACQFGWAVRHLSSSEIASCDASPWIVRIAQAICARLKSYAGMCMVFGPARNPERLTSAPFGHCYAMLLAPTAISKGAAVACDNPPTEPLIIECTAPLMNPLTAQDKPYFTRVFAVDAYPFAKVVPEASFMGVKEIDPRMYPGCWAATSHCAQVNLSSDAMPDRGLFTDAVVARLLDCEPEMHDMFDGISPFAYGPQCVLQKPPNAIIRPDENQLLKMKVDECCEDGYWFFAPAQGGNLTYYEDLDCKTWGVNKSAPMGFACWCSPYSSSSLSYA